VVGGVRQDLTVDRVSQVCEALHCSPYDMWGPELGRSVLHAYGPERWPKTIEPLSDGPGDLEVRVDQRRLHSTVTDAFLTRRLAQQEQAVAASNGSSSCRPVDPGDLQDGFDDAVATRAQPAALVALAQHHELDAVETARRLRAAGADLATASDAVRALVGSSDGATAVMSDVWHVPCQASLLDPSTSHPSAREWATTESCAPVGRPPSDPKKRRDREQGRTVADRLIDRWINTQSTPPSQAEETAPPFQWEPGDER
jgi:hypothetical protein